MKLTQLSIFIENRAGTLANIANTLGEAGINIRAMSLADTSEFGIIRLIIDDLDTARDVLKDQGYAVSISEVIAVEIPDRPGELGRLLGIFADSELNVEYMYAFVQKNMDRAVMILRLDDMDRAIEAAKANGVRILEGERVATM